MKRHLEVKTPSPCAQALRMKVESCLATGLDGTVGPCPRAEMVMHSGLAVDGRGNAVTKFQ